MQTDYFQQENPLILNHERSELKIMLLILELIAVARLGVQNHLHANN